MFTNGIWLPHTFFPLYTFSTLPLSIFRNSRIDNLKSSYTKNGHSWVPHSFLVFLLPLWNNKAFSFLYQFFVSIGLHLLLCWDQRFWKTSLYQCKTKSLCLHLFVCTLSPFSKSPNLQQHSSYVPLTGFSHCVKWFSLICCLVSNCWNNSCIFISDVISLVSVGVTVGIIVGH